TKSIDNRYNASETGLANVDLSFTDAKAKLKTIFTAHEQLESRISHLKRREDTLKTNAAKLESYVISLEERISMTQENYADEEQVQIATS
ncbi:hypothetical protein, partial [Escherichia coli]|uniref:hypothetical protein n=1 Tax=Escherichia coli TaxID=562 RepID=UPI0028DD72B6